MKRIFILCTIVIQGIFNLTAQDHSVDAKLFLTAPYSNYLSDYYAPGSNSMFANIHLLDNTISSLDVVFRVSIIGNDLQIRTKPTAIVSPVTLHGGILDRIDASRLQEYFLLQNIDVQGYKANEFINSGVLPEDYYTFSIEVLEFNRKVVISNKAFAFAWVITNEPPQWILPQNNSKVPANQPQNVLFSWMPMHTGSPNSAFSTQYEFKICEMPSAQADANVVISTTNPIYTEELMQSVLIYGADKPALEPSKLYVAQIRAFDMDGRDLFKNNGLSEPVVFKFGESCKTPLFVSHKDVTKVTSTFSWTPEVGNTSYVVELRQNNDDDLSDWYAYPSTENSLKISQLQPSTTYEYQVKAICGNEFTGISSPYSTIGSFSTMESGNATYNCNDVVGMPEITSPNKVNNLNVGQIIDAGGFFTSITKIDKAENGVFSGLCETTLAVWGLKIYCEFTNITINIDNQLLSGEIKALRTEDVNWVGDGPGGEDGNGSGSDGDSDGNGYDDLDNFEADTVIIVDMIIDSVLVDSTDNVIIYSGGGPIDILDVTDNLQIEDSDNNIYVVENGEVYKNPPGIESSTGGTGNLEYEKIIAASFSHAGLMQEYGFDERNKNIPAFDPQYNQVLIHQENTFVDWVSIESHMTDITSTTIHLKSDNGEYDDVKFRNLTGPAFPQTTQNDSIFYLMLQGSSHGTEQTYEAYYNVTDVNGKEKEVIAGQLNVISYDEQPVDVCIVSVNGTNYPYNTTLLQNKLNKIFAQGVAKITLTTSSLTGIDWDEDNNGSLSDEESGALGNYNDEMRVLKRAMRQSDNYDNDTYYLFMLPASDDGKDGYMPLKRQYGFIFVNDPDNGTEQKITHTIAHELSHGAFRLRHTFSSHNLYLANQGTTQNLMDYITPSENNPATQLRKYQWDYIHDPENMIGIFQDDTEGAYETNEYLAGKNVISGKFKNFVTPVNTEFFSFITEAGRLISIPIEASDVTFHNKGTLYAFTILENGKLERYVSAEYVKGENIGTFAGFIKETGTSTNHSSRVYKDNYSKKIKPGNAIVHFGFLSGKNDEKIECGIYLFEGEISTNEIGNSYNTGGNKMPFLTISQIKNKLMGSYESNFTSAYGNKLNFIKRIDSPQACNSCEKGISFFEQHKNLTENSHDIYFLTKISELICNHEYTRTNYNILVEQINKDFNDKAYYTFWKSDAALFRKARNAFWERTDAWELYFKALELTSEKIKTFNSQMNAKASKDDFCAALFYLNESFLKKLSVDKKLKIFKIVFEHNFFFLENMFDYQKSQAGLIKKILNTLNTNDLNDFISKIIDDPAFFKENRNRDALFEVAYGLDQKELNTLNIDIILSMFKTLLDGQLLNKINANGINQQELMVKILKAVNSNNADHFLKKIAGDKEGVDYSFDENPLIYHLKTKLRDVFIPNDPYTGMMGEILRLSCTRNPTEEMKKVTSVIIDIKEVNCVLFSFLRNKSDFIYTYDEETHKVDVEVCKSYIPLPQTELKYKCYESETVLEKESPFELVGITIINDISPFGSGCKDGVGKSEICGETIYVPALFLGYIEDKTDLQKWKIAGMNVISVAVGLTTLGEGVLAINSIRTAAAGTRLTIALKNSYAIADFTYTVSDMVVTAAGVDSIPGWKTLGYVFMAKDITDLTKKGMHSLDDIVYLKKANKSLRKQRLAEGKIKKANGENITESEFNEIVETTHNDIKNSGNQKLINEYDNKLKALDLTNQNKIADLLEKVNNPTPEFKKWMNSLEDSEDVLKKLDNFGDEINNLAKDFTSLSKKLNLSDPDVLSAYEVLKAFPTIRSVPENLQILVKTNGRFTYNNKNSFDGFNDIFNGKTRLSMKKFLENLSKADKLFPSTLPVKFTGIKSGEVKILDVLIIDSKGEEIARIISKVLKIKKYLNKGTEIGTINGKSILKNGDELGFKAE